MAKRAAGSSKVKPALAKKKGTHAPPATPIRWAENWMSTFERNLIVEGYSPREARKLVEFAAS